MLRFLGTGSAFNPTKVNTSAIYRPYTSTLLLIDCGERVFQKLLNSAILTEVTNLYVFITHTHSDHIGSLSTLIHYMYYKKNVKTNIITPLNSDNYVKDILLHMGNTEEQFTEVSPDDYDLVRTLNLSEIHTLPVQHTNLKSYAIELVDTDDYVTVYTGDTNDTEYLKRCLKYEKLHKIYCDISFYKGVHLDFNAAIELFKDYKNKVVFMHFDNNNIELELRGLGFKVAEEI